MGRKTLDVTVVASIEYSAMRFGGYGTETRYIHKFADAEGGVYVWKTTAMLGFDVESEKGDGYKTKGDKWLRWESVNRGDVVTISATIDGVSEYKGETQTEIKRVKVIGRTFKAKTPQEIEAEKKAEEEAKRNAQISSLQGRDFIWRMPYKQYKEHYSDCETVLGSFESENGKSYISVIIREGRLKASGTRGERFSGYTMENEDGNRVTYRAVCEENALKRVNKEFPGKKWECVKIYDYSNIHKIW